MGHLVGKDLYRQLGRKIDNLTIRAPWSETLYAILKELYTTDEAELAVKMPYGLATLEAVAKASGFAPDRARTLLDGLSDKGLVMDLFFGDAHHYMLSPLVIGIFEFTMMRTRGELNTKEWARLFHQYLNEGTWYRANFGHGERVGPMRTLPWEDAIGDGEHVEVLDYEKASTMVDRSANFAIGICSCRHEKLHAGTKTCNVPLEMCTSFGDSASYMVAGGFAKPATKETVRENIARAKEMGLVLCTDNIRQDASFICFCCGCCCNVLLGISTFGYPNTVVTSTYIAAVDRSMCSGCDLCAEACPIKAIAPQETGGPVINEAICIGCGVCGLKCDTGALTLVKRQQRVLHPETTFERILLQCLERGTLQNLLFADPSRLSHKFLRAFVGGFLRLSPVKRALMADTLRSSFLSAMRKGA